jgi:hypothetical protein
LTKVRVKRKQKPLGKNEAFPNTTQTYGYQTRKLGQHKSQKSRSRMETKLERNFGVPHHHN